jgi:hypothetical protein
MKFEEFEQRLLAIQNAAPDYENKAVEVNY